MAKLELSGVIAVVSSGSVFGAELGVESFEQVADLRARGICAAQGYVFAPPLPGSSFLTLLDALDPVAGQPASQAGLLGNRAA